MQLYAKHQPFPALKYQQKGFNAINICLFKLMENAMVPGAELSIKALQAFLGRVIAKDMKAEEGDWDAQPQWSWQVMVGKHNSVKAKS